MGKEETLLYLLAKKGPLVVSVDASTWNHYLGGIIQYHCGTTLNHAIQIVGYDLTGRVLVDAKMILFTGYNYLLEKVLTPI